MDVLLLSVLLWKTVVLLRYGYFFFTAVVWQAHIVPTQRNATPYGDMSTLLYNSSVILLHIFWCWYSNRTLGQSIYLLVNPLWAYCKIIALEWEVIYA